MRKVRDGEEKKKMKNEKWEKNDDYSGPLTSLPVDLPKVDRLQRQRSCQKKSVLSLHTDSREQHKFFFTVPA